MPYSAAGGHPAVRAISSLLSIGRIASETGLALHGQQHSWSGSCRRPANFHSGRKMAVHKPATVSSTVWTWQTNLQIICNTNLLHIPQPLHTNYTRKRWFYVSYNKPGDIAWPGIQSDCLTQTSNGGCKGNITNHIIFRGTFHGGHKPFVREGAGLPKSPVTNADDFHHEQVVQFLEGAERPIPGLGQSNGCKMVSPNFNIQGGLFWICPLWEQVRSVTCILGGWCVILGGWRG